MVNKPREDVPQILLCLNAVMKDYNRAGTGGVHRTTQAFLRRQALGIVMGEHIPHDNLVRWEAADLPAGDAAVRWTEEGKTGRWWLVTGHWLSRPGYEVRILNLGLAALNVVQVGFGIRLPAAEVVEGVVAGDVSCFSYFPENRRVFSNVVADAKERSPGTGPLKFIQDKLGRSGYGAVIKSEVQFFLISRNPPGQLWIQPGQESGGAKQVQAERVLIRQR